MRWRAAFLISQKSRGFTLIETLVSLTVLAVIAALAAPSFRNLILQQRIRASAFDMYSAMVQARSEAITRHQTIYIYSLSGGTDWGSGWCVSKNTSGNCDSSDANAIRRFGINSTSLQFSTNLTSGNSVGFGVTGRPTTAFKLSVSSSIGTTTARCIGIDTSGRPYSKEGTCT